MNQFLFSQKQQSIVFSRYTEIYRWSCLWFTSREFLPDGVEQSHLVRRQLEAAVQRSTGSQRQREEQGQWERRCYS